MKIAFLGTRGIPANYGGFETFVEQLSVRLAQRGHDVTVYCRKSSYAEHPPEHNGVKRVTLSSVHTKYFDTLSHTFLSALHVLSQRADIVYCCNSANACFMWIPRLFGANVILNTDGLEWERAKWNWAGKTFYKFSEFLAVLFPNRLVSDSKVIQRYYKEKFRTDSEFVAYGADVLERGTGSEYLASEQCPEAVRGISPESYFLFVSRLEPENNPHLVVKAFEQVQTDKKLLIVGSAPFAAQYIRDLKATTDTRIVFPGALYGETYRALQANAYAYVNAMEVGGTHPAILEAMGAGNCVLVSDIAYNEEAVAHAGVTFTNKNVDDLRTKLQWLVDNPGEVARYRKQAVTRVRLLYNWESVTDEYERIFVEMRGK
jgi:glycosyltransferase involved in cell wall biosynthesis